MSDEAPRDLRTPEQIAAVKEKMRKMRDAQAVKRNQWRKTEEERIRELEEEQKQREEEARWAGSANLGGLTARVCPYDCTVDRCVISGINVCAHPSFGGPQAVLRTNRAVMERYEKAMKLIQHQKIEMG
jgi:hypothetical protein